MSRVHRPESLEEVLHLLDEVGDAAKLIAGGTAIMPMRQAGLLDLEQFVALDWVSGLTYIDPGPSIVRMGALTSLRALERSAPLRRMLPTLAATVDLVANHRVRQRATIGGNVSEADYASDLPAVLASLDCRVRVASSLGEREIPLLKFVVSYYETVLAANEMVTEVLVPRPPQGARTTYIKYVSRAAEDRPCVGVAGYLEVDGSNRCVDLKVAVAGATAVPFVLDDLSNHYRGAVLSESIRQEIGSAYREAIEPIADARGSSGYRKHVTGELVCRVLETVSAGAENGATRL